MSQNTENSQGGNTITPWQPKSLRRMCFTLNNWTTEEHDKYVEYGNTLQMFICFGKEIGENGTPHLH